MCRTHFYEAHLMAMKRRAKAREDEEKAARASMSQGGSSSFKSPASPQVSRIPVPKLPSGQSLSPSGESLLAFRAAALEEELIAISCLSTQCRLSIPSLQALPRAPSSSAHLRRRTRSIPQVLLSRPTPLLGSSDPSRIRVLSSPAETPTDSLPHLRE
jgi:hypothetical protein